MKQKRFQILCLLIVVIMLLTACAPAAPAEPIIQTVVVEGTPKVVEVVATAVPAEPTAAESRKVLKLNFDLGDVPTLDPALATDVQSIQISEEIYYGLTRLSGEDSVGVYPGLATDWEVSEDGTVYKYNLRQDVPWVRYDAKTDQVVQVMGCDEKPRMVTAKDFEYGMLRALNPETASDYAYLLAFVIDGAGEYNSGAAADSAGVGVKALDDYTLEVRFKDNAAYNNMIMGVWTAYATPKWQIEGDDCTEGKTDRWVEQGNNQSYGPFVLKEWVHDSHIIVTKNPFWPGTEISPQPKLDEIQWTMLDPAAAFSEFEAGNMDVIIAPAPQLDRVLGDPALNSMVKITPRFSTNKLNFNTKAKHVDDVRVRRALSMAIDRQSLAENVVKGGVIPASWFCAPGLAGCPLPEDYPDTGIKSNAEEAKKLLNEYLTEKNLKVEDVAADLSLWYYTNSTEKAMCEAIQGMWRDTLGLDVQVVNQEFKVFLKSVLSPTDTPPIFDMGWGADYPDANNFTREVLSFGGASNPAAGGGLNWKNEEFEKLVVEAAAEQDAQKRTDMYARAEHIASYEDAVIVPLYWRTQVWVTRPNITRTYEKTSPQHFETWDMTVE